MTSDLQNNVTKNNFAWFKSGIFLLDGGWGTQLQARGLAVGEHPDLWNLSNPDAVFSVAESYVSAGSDVILSNTFGSSRFVLARNGAEDKVELINRAGVAISKRAANGKAKVFASMGPSGVMLISGNVTEQELYDAFLVQATAIATEQPDGIVIETMSDPAEAAVAVKAAKTTGLPVAVCMVFDSGKNKDRTMMGTTPEQAVSKLTEAGADIIGSNCGQGVDGFIPICKRMRAVTELPIWMKANAGLPQVIDGRTAYSQSPEEFAEKAKQLIDAGANFIGGCCGTTPEFIANLRKYIGKS
ncbi:MAG: homocysteine S-methyltransferase family protein [Planctomycetaceae bacterium]|jgi:methionine synthase I (cobalamin-dependent)|nr:homocysteine S-methyltransferase family protein [Planctomycetaceae bacterium]